MIQNSKFLSRENIAIEITFARRGWREAFNFLHQVFDDREASSEMTSCKDYDKFNFQAKKYRENIGLDSPSCCTVHMIIIPRHGSSEESRLAISPTV
jgi:hypothetical protein